MTAANSDLGSRLLLRYFTSDMTWRDYKMLADWLCCYGYECKADRSSYSESDRELIQLLLNTTDLNLTTIYHKIIFLKDCNDGYKTKAIELLKSAHTAQLPT